jgi:hypothetical protein
LRRPDLNDFLSRDHDLRKLLNCNVRFRVEKKFASVADMRRKAAVCYC